MNFKSLATPYKKGKIKFLDWTNSQSRKIKKSPFLFAVSAHAIVELGHSVAMVTLQRSDLFADVVSPALDAFGHAAGQ